MNKHIDKNITNRYSSIIETFKDEPVKRLIPLEESIEIQRSNIKSNINKFNTFNCKNCKLLIRNWLAVQLQLIGEDEENGKITDFVPYLFAFKFCPNCGAKILNEDGVI